ncbi:hypothetical protein [Futiania mangrovi]|uniref:Permease n=1 Tax=Futiania mangrovi TaxID=2959716 RepID=A0A9J6PGR0_9PROT|nr:hypothetical protein [Futiania mangrovii]MCP1337008.1 hypothetical protein [Futiania mangrovii]
MLGALLFIYGLLGAVALYAHMRRGPEVHAEAAGTALAQLKPLALRMPLAMLLAGFLSHLIPPEMIVSSVGAEAGLRGILAASLVGMLMPGGPMVTFPVVIVLFRNDAGAAQMVALLTSWAVLAGHRVLAFEAPLLGWRFVALRLVPSLPLPVIAGLLAQAVLDARLG